MTYKSQDRMDKSPPVVSVIAIQMELEWIQLTKSLIIDEHIT